jgi:hypothetical protein
MAFILSFQILKSNLNFNIITEAYKPNAFKTLDRQRFKTMLFAMLDRQCFKPLDKFCKKTIIKTVKP